MAGAAEEPIFKNKTFTLSAHGANTGTFFTLPPNTRIFIPSINDVVYASVDAECAFARLNLITIDPVCSNINSILNEYFESQKKVTRRDFSYKIYDSQLGIRECPNITYSPELDRFVTGVAECPVTIKQTYLKNYESKSQYGNFFRQAGDVITITGADEKIRQFNTSFRSFGFRSIDEMFSEEDGTPRGNLKKSIIAHLLFPFTKRLNQGISVVSQLPDYITYYDSSRFTTLQHLAHQMTLPSIVPFDLANIIYFYRQKIDRESPLGHQTVITFITDACNKIPEGLEEGYKIQDKGILYDEFLSRIPFYGLAESVRRDIADQTIAPELIVIKDQLDTFFKESHKTEERKAFIKGLFTRFGIIDGSQKLNLEKTELLFNKQSLVSPEIKNFIHVYVVQLGSSINNNYYLKYLKYKNKYLKLKK